MCSSHQGFAMEAITIQKLTSAIFIILFITSNFIPIITSHQDFSNKEISGGLIKRKKSTHLHFYFHDIVSGPHRTAVPVASASTTNSSATGFGSVKMIDDPLTMGPNMSSKIVGRAQGFYASADLEKLGLLVAMSFVFTEGKFNGSTLSVLGRNEVFSAVREMPVVGGSGVFRFGHGYAQAKTHEINAQAAVVEYNVYVFHY